MLKNLMFLILVFSSPMAFAAGGGDSSSAGGEDKKIPEEEDWAKQINVLNTKEAKVKVYSEDIKRMIQEKEKAKTKGEKQQIINNMIKTHKLLQEESAAYNSMRVKIKYRFPAKNDYTERRYLPIRVMSLENMEAHQSEIDSMLTRVRKNIVKKYKPFLSKDLIEEQERGPASMQERLPPEEKKGLDKKIIMER